MKLTLYPQGVKSARFTKSFFFRSEVFQNIDTSDKIPQLYVAEEKMQKCKVKMVLLNAFSIFGLTLFRVGSPENKLYFFRCQGSEVAYGIVKMAAETSLEEQDVNMEESTPSKEQGVQKMFTLKKWNAVAMWSWDVECDTCAICRVQVMGQFLLSNKLKLN